MGQRRGWPRVPGCCDEHGPGRLGLYRTEEWGPSLTSVYREAAAGVGSDRHVCCCLLRVGCEWAASGDALARPLRIAYCVGCGGDRRAEASCTADRWAALWCVGVGMDGDKKTRTRGANAHAGPESHSAAHPSLWVLPSHHVIACRWLSSPTGNHMQPHATQRNQTQPHFWPGPTPRSHLLERTDTAIPSRVQPTRRAWLLEGSQPRAQTP
jgi:hypothetical protein